MKLGPDQEDAVTYLVEHDETLLIAPMGAGKTAVLLRAMAELAGEHGFGRFLVLAPLKVAESTWPEEGEKWGGLPMKLALGNASDRTEAITAPDARVVILNYDNLAWAASTFDLPALFDGLVVDESTRLASTGGVGFRRLRRHITGFRWRVCMSGEPVAQGLDKLFGQMLVVDGGASLGTSKSRFLETWFRPVDWERRRWEPNPMLVDKLVERVKGHVYTMPDYRDTLPDLIIERVWMDLPARARETYETLAADSVLGDVTAANEAVLIGKLLQVSAGTVYGDDGFARYVHGEKWRTLDRVLADADGPVIIVYAYVWQRERLEQRGVPVYSAELKGAWNCGRVPVMAVHPKSCGHGLNLQDGGARVVFLGPIWSLDQYQQTIARLWRRGQEQEVHVSVICARDTADEAVLARLEGNAGWHAMLLDHLAVAKQGAD